MSRDLKSAVKNLEKVNTIFFDLDGTLRHKRPMPSDAMLAFAIQAGIDDSPEKRREIAVWEHYYWGRSEELLGDIDAHDGFTEAFWENYVKRHLSVFGCDRSCIESLTSVVAHYMQEEYNPEIYVESGTAETLQKLIDAGFQLGLLSNRREPCQETLEEMGLLQYFPLVLVAGEVGAWKPETPLFEHAVAKFGIEPQEAVYIGDNYFTDVVGSQSAGLQPVLYDPRNVFPDAECPVIRAIAELQFFANGRN